EGDELQLMPVGQPVRVRGVQVHSAAVKQAVAGQRTAINLGGTEVAAIERGMVLATPGRLRRTQIVDASVQLLADAPRALRSRQRVRVHLGAAEVLARVRVLENGSEIAAAARGYAQLRFEAPIVGVLGDRFIVRAYSPQMTIGGGVILDPFAARHRAKDFTQLRTSLDNLSHGDHALRVSQFVISAGVPGVRREDIAARTAWRDEVIATALKAATNGGAILNIENTFIARAAFDGLERQVLAEVTAYHKHEPLARGLSKEILRERFFAGVTPDAFRAVLTELERRGSIVVEKDIVRLPAHTRALSDDDARQRELLEKTFRESGVAPPSIAEAFAKAGLNTSAQHARKLLQLLIDSGALVKVHGEMFFHRAALDDLTKKLRAQADRTPDRAIDVGSFKDLAGISRKYAIPLLEYFDRQRVTRREGERRIVL
ncbi:MAG TPA: SelB C-terminal domain-containing protein, partial [Pyrinomonadaceae bacterium]|nr:SelB C-terminal domain-containing protein [Pyrinomonadaceae bacterium]